MRVNIHRINSYNITDSSYEGLYSSFYHNYVPGIFVYKVCQSKKIVIDIPDWSGVGADAIQGRQWVVLCETRNVL